MRIYQEYRETTNSSLFRKLHKSIHASCDYCSWHGYSSENKSWKWYHVYLEDEKDTYWRKAKKKGEGRFPNWKLVSKNKKQWMKKPLIQEKTWDSRTQDWDESVWLKW